MFYSLTITNTYETLVLHLTTWSESVPVEITHRNASLWSPMVTVRTHDLTISSAAYCIRGFRIIPSTNKDYFLKQY
jgi:hypothetical protein